MVSRLPKTTLLLASVLSLSLMLVGCDSVGSGGQVGSPDDNQQEEPLFEVTNDLGARMTLLGKTAPMSAPKAASEFSLTSVAQVAPPGDTTRASHLSYASGTVYAGYKALGAPLKGGIDILDASDPTNLLEVSSIGGNNLDVQEVAYDADENALYVAGALKPSTFGGDLKGTPSSLIRVTNFSDPETLVAGLTGTVGKSVVTAPDSDGAHDVYVATDEEVMYRYDADLGNEVLQEVPGAEFRAVAATSSDVFTVDRTGTVYASDVGSASSFTEVQTLGSGVDAQAIGRMQARGEPVLNEDRLFLALGADGIAVLDAGSGDVLFRQEGPYYTSLTLHEDDPDVTDEPTDLVYATRPNGILDVYRVGDDGIDTGDTSTGLDEVGTFDLSELAGINLGPSPQVNQVVGVGCHVYVANSNEGIAVLEISNGAGCGPGGDNQLPTATADSDQTTAGQPTTTAVLANDSDPDGSLDASTVQVQSQPSDGAVSVDGSTGEITYTPDNGFTGQDDYTYTVEDNEGGTSNEATVAITVEAPDPPPPPSNAKAISFAAFCTTQDPFDEDDVTITDVLYKNDNPDEPVSIAWTSQTPLSTVVLKAGPNMYNYAGGTSGGAASEEGTSAGSEQSPPSPCPDGEDLVIKDENVGDGGGGD